MVAVVRVVVEGLTEEVVVRLGETARVVTVALLEDEAVVLGARTHAGAVVVAARSSTGIPEARLASSTASNTVNRREKKGDIVTEYSMKQKRNNERQ